ncbi:hypothetical protein [Primorskyibacter sp. S87]|uniref:hypothetical protein n=1 Tax=Primorskyibacter sp. S87 TaxID=3415126 RepID=UPI003C7AA6D6
MVQPDVNPRAGGQVDSSPRAVQYLYFLGKLERDWRKMIRLATVIVAASTLFVNATEATAENWKRIKTEADFMNIVVGKSLSGDFGKAKIKANGTGSGKTTRGQYKINWVWDNGRYCRNFRFGNKEPTGTICAHIDVAGNKVQFSNTSGKKTVSVWTMK